MDIEKQLQRLSKVDPGSKFCNEAKARLMHQIALETPAKVSSAALKTKFRSSCTVSTLRSKFSFRLASNTFAGVSLEANEKWFLRFLKRVAPVMPSRPFMQHARMRVIERIRTIRQPLFGWFLFAKRATASTLAMVIAVTSTLFFVEGQRPVNASENTYLEVLSGEVNVKHVNGLIWDVVTDQMELSTGDMIRLTDSTSAVIHFFDDSEMRLAENALLSLNRLEISPGFARQGVIEASLHEGRAWVQTLNVEDGYARFSLITPDAIVSTPNASFDVQTALFEPTRIRVFKHGVEVQALEKDSQNVFATGKLTSFQKITLEARQSPQLGLALAHFASTSDLTATDSKEAWVMNNLQIDRHHLAELRERELVNLRSATGALPGHVFYPVKRAKERLSLALSFKNESQTNAQINIANQRLNEAIVLIEQGETEKATLALSEYQNLVHRIVKSVDQTIDIEQLSNLILAPPQKTLMATLPGDAHIGMVKRVLNETEELFAEGSLERAEIRLQNVLDDLIQIPDLIASDELENVETILANRETLISGLLEEAAQFEDEEQRKVLYNQILETQYQERRILNGIMRDLANQPSDSPLFALVQNADQHLTAEIKKTATVVRSLLPDVMLRQVVALKKDQQVQEFVDKVNIYQTWQGQKNQINRLLTKYPKYARDMDFLLDARDQLDAQASDIINMHVLELERSLTEAKSKAVQRKIDRAMKYREIRLLKQF